MNNDRTLQFVFTLLMTVPFGMSIIMGADTGTGPIPFILCWLFCGALCVLICWDIPYFGWKQALKLTLAWLPAIWSDRVMWWVAKE